MAASHRHPKILKEDDNNWPMPDRVGKQELEIKMNGEHICFNTTKLGSVLQVQQSKDPDGLRIFYYLVQVCVGVWCLVVILHTRGEVGRPCLADTGAAPTLRGGAGGGLTRAHHRDAARVAVRARDIC